MEALGDEIFSPDGWLANDLEEASKRFVRCSKLCQAQLVALRNIIDEPVNTKLGPSMILPESLRPHLDSSLGLHMLTFQHDTSMLELNRILAKYFVAVARHPMNRRPQETDEQVDERAFRIEKMMLKGKKNSTFSISIFYEFCDVDIGEIEFLMGMTTYEGESSGKQVLILEYAAAPPGLGKRNGAACVELLCAAYEEEKHGFIIQSVGTHFILSLWGCIEKFQSFNSDITPALFYGLDADQLMHLAEIADGVSHGVGLFLRINQKHADYKPWSLKNRIPDMRRANHENVKFQVMRDESQCVPTITPEEDPNTPELAGRFPYLFPQNRLMTDIDGFYDFPQFGEVKFEKLVGRFSEGIIHSMEAHDCPMGHDGGFSSTACIYSATVTFFNGEADGFIRFRSLDEGLVFQNQSLFSGSVAPRTGDLPKSLKPMEKTPVKSILMPSLKKVSFKKPKKQPANVKRGLVKTLKKTGLLRIADNRPNKRTTSETNPNTRGVASGQIGVWKPSFGGAERTHDAAYVRNDGAFNRKRKHVAEDRIQRRKRQKKSKGEPKSLTTSLN